MGKNVCFLISYIITWAIAEPKTVATSVSNIQWHMKYTLPKHTNM